jgi:hypothetical protein
VTVSVDGGAPTTINNPTLSASPPPENTSVTDILAPVGSDTFTVKAYDRTNAGGNLLGDAVAVPFTVVLDAANTLSVTLNGNLAEIACAPLPPFVTGTTSLTMVGGAGQIALLPEDADGNVIVAPGAIPALTLTPVNSSQATVSPTAVTNDFDVNIKAEGPTVELTGSGDNLSGTPVSVTCSVTRVPALYVANHSVGGTSPSVAIYPASATSASTPTATLAGSKTGLIAIQFVAVDPAGNLFVSNLGPMPGATYGPSAGFVSIYSAGADQDGNQAPIATIPNINTPEGLAFDSSNALHVLSIDRITTYPASADGVTAPAAASSTIVGSNTDLFSCYGMFVDAPGNIYTACSNVLNVFAPGASGNATPGEVESVGATSSSESSHSWLDVAADSGGNFYAPASNNNLNFVEVYAPGSAANPAATPLPTIAKSVDFSQPIGIFISAAGNIYVSNYGASTVDVFSSETVLETGVPTNSVSSGINAPYGLTVR